MILVLGVTAIAVVGTFALVSAGLVRLVNRNLREEYERGRQAGEFEAMSAVAARSARCASATALAVPNPCTVCRQPIVGNVVVAMGDGTMRDGWAHPECWRLQRAEARVAELEKGADAARALVAAVDKAELYRITDRQEKRAKAVEDAADQVRTALAALERPVPPAAGVPVVRSTVP